MTDPIKQAGGSIGRIAWIDITKAAAAWMVVTSHLLRRGAITDYLAAVSVVVFYLLAGMTMHAHVDTRAFLARLLRRIVLPYLAAGLVSIAVYRILGGYAAARLGTAVAKTTLSEDLWHLFYASSVQGRMKWNESLWFLPSYCVMILLAEGIERISEGHAQLRVALYLIGGAVGCALIGSGHVGLPWHLETALLVLPLCGLGQYLRYTLLGGRMQPWFALLFGAALFCYSMELYPGVRAAAGGDLSLRAPQLPDAGATYLFLLVSGLAVIYLVWFCAWFVPLPEVLMRVGAHSLDIVLWNKFPVLAMQVLVPAIIPGFGTLYIEQTSGQALLVAAVLALPCMALCLVWAAWYRHILARFRR